MKIKRLVIENFKSIERIELIEPNPFTVFVGPNGSGKSNIFEALEFFDLVSQYKDASSLFGGLDSIRRKQNTTAEFRLSYELEKFLIERDNSIETTTYNFKSEEDSALTIEENTGRISYKDQEFQQFLNFSRIFVGNKNRLERNDNKRLSLSASNLEKVLKRILSDNTLKNEIFEWLELFVPEFKAVEIDDRDELHWFEEFAPNYFTKDLISDGTYNILALLTAVYQSDDKPQFLCIEEPENGLHPQVARELVDFFRIMCEERGHHIWLNTHSQSMIARVKPEEMVIVDKKQGTTRIKQISKEEFKNWRMDEALLMNAFGGGLAW
ncbi:AAA family ATPase [Spirosoma foliorum]|uniref:AAA family ATPase n=1 Tax=Spirosoma foliorum TaxID=2710596 RepID=A0A7G5H689_9BACT|nr:ATP-binding protein [Spirosoma foliorum]QMW06631.1 AAA family ATPase [Spirosoma foliorum]